MDDRTMIDKVIANVSGPVLGGPGSELPETPALKLP
jgi:hypothetical protein